MRFLRFANAPVEMTYKEKSSFNGKTSRVNNLQKQKIRKQNVSRHSNLQSDVPNTSSRAKQSVVERSPKAPIKINIHFCIIFYFCK
ncbi:hypothetical protein PEPMIC_00854 [Parvimonas micra ATCC 33270]|uniref:Uncharacterized protein n=1 Tax=Parvimonas micra ATCC 33270 TaxID=411465 RepID=A8SL30_9FIRM|nr:hypothetical protein PEPMIC_00854 [Parvimonas micra ATCC 33270]